MKANGYVLLQEQTVKYFYQINDKVYTVQIKSKWKKRYSHPQHASKSARWEKCAVTVVHNQILTAERAWVEGWNFRQEEFSVRKVLQDQVIKGE